MYKISFALLAFVACTTFAKPGVLTNTYSFPVEQNFVPLRPQEKQVTPPVETFPYPPKVQPPKEYGPPKEVVPVKPHVVYGPPAVQPIVKPIEIKPVKPVATQYTFNIIPTTAAPQKIEIPAAKVVKVAKTVAKPVLSKYTFKVVETPTPTPVKDEIVAPYPAKVAPYPAKVAPYPAKVAPYPTKVKPIVPVKPIVVPVKPTVVVKPVQTKYNFIVEEAKPVVPVPAPIPAVIPAPLPAPYPAKVIVKEVKPAPALKPFKPVQTKYTFKLEDEAPVAPYPAKVAPYPAKVAPYTAKAADPVQVVPHKVYGVPF